jgi:hypothetical protein
MREAAKLTAFILLIIGTISLIVNEFIFDWGRVSTLIFAASNVIGLAILATIYLRMKDRESKKEDQ